MKSAISLSAALFAILGVSNVQAGNPMEHVGIEHNVYLGCLMRANSDQSIPALARIVDECGLRVGTSTEEFVAYYQPLLNSNYDDSVVQQVARYRSLFTLEQFAYLEQIDRIFAMSRDESEILSQLARLESHAIANLGTKSRAEQAVFAGLSTAQYSLKFWAERNADSVSAKRAKWWQIVLSDLAGAVVGTALGGPALGGGLAATCSAGAAKGD
jgi:hypothetical protein